MAEITIGGTTYSKAEAIDLLGQPDGDKTFTMCRALVSAKLNVLIGNDVPLLGMPRKKQAEKPRDKRQSKARWLRRDRPF